MLKSHCVLYYTVVINKLNTDSDRPSRGIVDTCGMSYHPAASNGLISDANWKCSDDEENGWFNQDFDDRHWTSAYVIGSNAQNPASLRKSEEILDDAKFISSTSNYRQHHHGFYCRGSLGWCGNVSL